MASIHGLTVTSWPVGQLRAAQQNIATVEPMPGYDGLGVVKSGWQTEPVEVTTLTRVASGGLSAAELILEAYRSRHGKVGLVVDQFGRQWSDVTVLRVTPELFATVQSTVYLIRARWLLLVPVTRPPGAGE